MNKLEVYDFIKSRGIWYEIEEHEAVYNMKELGNIEVLHPEYDAKNIFICDDKKKSFFLITVKGDKRVDLKKFRDSFNTRSLRFVSLSDMIDILGLTPGSVTPLGLLNDRDLKVRFCLDEDFFKGEKIIGVHPCDNTATVWLCVDDLLDIIREHGNCIDIISVN